MTASTPTLARPSRLGIIAAIVQKDFKAFTRDRLYLFLSILGLVAYVIIFWVLPDTVDETVNNGATGAGIQELLAQATGEEQAASVLAFATGEVARIRVHLVGQPVSIESESETRQCPLGVALREQDPAPQIHRAAR